MRRRSAGLTASRRPRPFGFAAQLVFAWLALAFAAQAFIVQTHVHFTPADQTQLANRDAAFTTGTAKWQRHGAPARQRHGNPADDAANCPLCQEYLSAGNYLVPIAIVLLPPPFAVSLAALKPPARLHAWTPSYNWRSRAPPPV